MDSLYFTIILFLQPNREPLNHSTVLDGLHPALLNLPTATCRNPGGKGYRQFHLEVCVKSHQDVVEIKDIQPYRTQKYNQESEVSSSSKRGWTSSVTAAIAAILPQLFGAGATRTVEQGTSIEKTANISRNTQLDMEGDASWGFYITDPFEQTSGITLPPEKLPRALFEFVGTTDIPAPPSEHLNVEISSYWSLLPHDGGDALGNSEGTSFSNICKIVKLQVPSNLRGRWIYRVNLKVCPEENTLYATQYHVTVKRNGAAECLRVFNDSDT